MIQNVLSIADKNFLKVNMFSGANSIQHCFYENDVECFVVYKSNELVGIVTERELIRAHPNRIIADVMSDRYICVKGSTYIWKTLDIFNKNEDLEIILVEEKNVIVGFITKMILKIELGKHIDLLTEFYKSDYIFYNAYRFIQENRNISIIFMDLDNFGFINKKYGHIKGDKILKSVASILKKNIIVFDSICFCRYAGDEFAILTSYSSSENKALAEQLISSIKKSIFPDKILVSVSIGIAEYKAKNLHEETDILNCIDKLINAASLASTRAKNISSHLFIADGIDNICFNER